MTQGGPSVANKCRWFASFPDKGRLAGSIVYFALGGIILAAALIWRRDEVFYDTPRQGFSNTWRIAWCIAFVFWGFAAIAYRSSKVGPHSSRASKSYPTRYLITLILISVLVFAVLPTFDRSSGYLFYFYSVPILFILGYNSDTLQKPLWEWFQVWRGGNAEKN
jgi:hypothetical protein